MKKIIPALVLVLGGIGLAACGSVSHHHSSYPQHSKSYEAGVAWVRNDFPGSNNSMCLTSIYMGNGSCTQVNSFCESNAASFAIANGNYNLSQWVDGCASVPFKHWPKWLQQAIINANNG